MIKPEEEKDRARTWSDAQWHGEIVPVKRPRRGPGRPTARALEGEPETREQVLTHARLLFMQRGFASVSVGEVAEAVGVTKPTLYYHFGDKEGLYTAVLCDVMHEVGGYIRQVTESPLSLRQRLYEVTLGYFLYANATMEPMLRDTNELIGAERAAQVWDAYRNHVLAPLHGLMEEGMARHELRQGDADILVRAFLALLDGFTDPGGHTARSHDEHQHMAETLIALFLHGAAVPGALSE